MILPSVEDQFILCDKNELYPSKYLDVPPIYKKCIKIYTTSGYCILPIGTNVFIVSESNFIKGKGYIKTINTIPIDGLNIGDILLTSYNGLRMIPDTDKCDKINIYDILVNISNLFPGYDICGNDNLVWLLGPAGRITSKYDKYMDASSLVQLLAWYITEGWTSQQYKINKRCSRFLSCFSQSPYSNFENVENIHNILNKLNIPISASVKKCDNIETEITYNFNSVISALMQSCGERSDAKHIPNWLYNILLHNRRLALDFINTMVSGDGHYDIISGLYSYSSISKMLLRQLSILIKRCGMYVKTYNNKNHKQITITFGSKNRKIGLIRYDNDAMTKIKNIEICNNIPCINIDISDNFIYVGELGNIKIPVSTNN